MIYDHTGKPVASLTDSLRTRDKWANDGIKDIIENMLDKSSKDKDIYVYDKEGPLKQDVTVLPADDPKALRLGWTVYEEIGVAVINNYALAGISVFDGIRTIERAIEPIFEMEDYIDPRYWPEWRVVFDDDSEMIVQAPSKGQARATAHIARPL